MTREQIIEETMKPYAGPTVPGVNTATLTGKVMCGYQGWFNAEGDGANRGWTHWNGPQGFKPGSCKIDLWPDVSEFDADERYATLFKLADGRAAEVFSSYNKKTVLRHFQWMRDYGIDGVWVQRFAGVALDDRSLRNLNTVLANCREGANRLGRAYAVMYDLTGMDDARMPRVMDDWRALVERMKITSDPAYARHNGKPVVSIWGIGFNDNRRYSLAKCMEFVRFLKDDPKCGGCTVMIGVPTGWRTLNRDAMKDPLLLEIAQKADIVSPWTIGRYQSPQQATDHAVKVVRPDIAWCKEHGKEYLPVVFPGFSWHNMKPESRSDQIPRLKGKFLWTQYAEDKKAGATMFYQAMFDEVDEGTAIFKCTNNPPVGDSKFVTYEGLPSDYYLWLVGMGGKMLRGEIPVSNDLPQRVMK
ncbi:MAG: glycoside hydrolase family 71/99-like protein [Candidatus Sumerlaeota bacterium]|nr:glycoside hydrolase family 71/99-like protein [Candidatus Sumerlaeota bacterium]